MFAGASTATVAPCRFARVPHRPSPAPVNGGGHRCRRSTTSGRLHQRASGPTAVVMHRRAQDPVTASLGMPRPPLATTREVRSPRSPPPAPGSWSSVWGSPSAAADGALSHAKDDAARKRAPFIFLRRSSEMSDFHERDAAPRRARQATRSERPARARALRGLAVGVTAIAVLSGTAGTAMPHCRPGTPHSSGTRSPRTRSSAPARSRAKGSSTWPTSRRRCTAP